MFNNEQKSSLGGHPARSSGCSSFEKPVATSLDTSSQRRWLRRHKCICTTYVKIQHTAQVSEGLALELGDVNRNTHPMLRRTRRTFHRHTGREPTSSGMSRNGLRSSPEQRTCSQKACHPQSQPARVIEGVAIVGVSPAGGHISAAMRRWHRRLRWRFSLCSLSGEDVAATWTLGGQKARTRRARVKKTPMDLELADTCSSLFRQSLNTHLKAR